MDYCEIMSSIDDIIKKVFDVKDIKDSDGPDDIAGWDSISHLELVSEMEDAFSVDLDVDEISEMQTVEKIKEILKKHGVTG